MYPVKKKNDRLWHLNSVLAAKTNESSFRKIITQTPNADIKRLSVCNRFWTFCSSGINDILHVVFVTKLLQYNVSMCLCMSMMCVRKFYGFVNVKHFFAIYFSGTNVLTSIIKTYSKRT